MEPGRPGAHSAMVLGSAKPSQWKPQQKQLRVWSEVQGACVHSMNPLATDTMVTQLQCLYP